MLQSDSPRGQFGCLPAQSFEALAHLGLTQFVLQAQLVLQACKLSAQFRGERVKRRCHYSWRCGTSGWLSRWLQLQPALIHWQILRMAAVRPRAPALFSADFVLPRSAARLAAGHEFRPRPVRAAGLQARALHLSNKAGV